MSWRFIRVLSPRYRHNDYTEQFLLGESITMIGVILFMALFVFFGESPVLIIGLVVFLAGVFINARWIADDVRTAQPTEFCR